MSEFTFEQLLAYSTSLTMYFIITLPIFIIFIIDVVMTLVHKFKKIKNNN